MLAGARFVDAPHLGPSLDPIAHGLVNAAYGYPLRDIFGAPPFLSGVNVMPPHPTGGSTGVGTSTSLLGWPSLRQFPAALPGTVFAVVHLASASESGIFVGIGDSNGSDTGMTLGVGATAANAVGNNLNGVRGGINVSDPGAVAIGQGVHSVAWSMDNVSAAAWYVDGEHKSSGGTGATWTLASGVAALIVGNHQAGGSSFGLTSGATVLFAAAWSRVLARDEVRAMHADPLRIVNQLDAHDLWDLAPAGAVPAGPAQRLKVRSGGVWVPGTLKVRSGGAWVEGTPYHRSGGAWT